MATRPVTGCTPPRCGSWAGGWSWFGNARRKSRPSLKNLRVGSLHCSRGEVIGEVPGFPARLQGHNSDILQEASFAGLITVELVVCEFPGLGAAPCLGGNWFESLWPSAA